TSTNRRAAPAVASPSRPSRVRSRITACDTVGKSARRAIVAASLCRGVREKHGDTALWLHITLPPCRPAPRGLEAHSVLEENSFALEVCAAANEKFAQFGKKSDVLNI